MQSYFKIKLSLISSIILLSTGCSYTWDASDEGIATLNSRVDNGVVLLGSDTADQSNKELKSVLIRQDDNILSPAQNAEQKSYTSIFEHESKGVEDNSHEANYAVKSKVDKLNQQLINQLKLANHNGKFSHTAVAKTTTAKSTAKNLNNKTAKNLAKTTKGGFADTETKNTKVVKKETVYKSTTFKGISFNRQQLRQLMDGYSADFDQYASEDQLSRFAHFVRGAMNNKPEYQSNLGDFYLDGVNGENYEELALSWYLIAASNNDAYAQYMLSILYERGIGVPQDLSKSVAWYKNAQGLKNSSDAKILVAKRFASPTSSIYDKQLALQWMESAAKDDNMQAQELLGDMYAQGRGAEKSDLDALKWYAKAAAQESTYAQYSLGLMFYNGQGVAQNLQEASRLLSAAAFGGNTEAQVLLSKMYEQGFGVKKDKPTAYALLKLVSDDSVVTNEADSKLKNLIISMTPEERIRAENLSKYFKSKVVTI